MQHIAHQFKISPAVPMSCRRHKNKNNNKTKNHEKAIFTQTVIELKSY
jgi:hypothetical protein